MKLEIGKKRIISVTSGAVNEVKLIFEFLKTQRFWMELGSVLNESTKVELPRNATQGVY